MQDSNESQVLRMPCMPHDVLTGDRFGTSCGSVSPEVTGSSQH